ncbi:MAG: 6-phosphofructokinase [Bacteroidales bacterium]|jgi:6-phosphofructokinase 1|nr:6-phosphofructokinase [Bacteroidales bacterium]
MKHDIRKIAILTSGGDAPGMNAAIRAVVRTALDEKISVTGIMHGYQGLIDREFIPLYSSSVSSIIGRGGTFLKSSRSKEFRTPEGRAKAYQNLQDENIDAIVVIGGDGTFRGGELLMRECNNFPVIGLPGTIDNDLYGTDNTIGYDTALNTVVSAVDKIRDTAGSHDIIFFVEVMGRDAGYVALNSGIAVGAENILVPEEITDVDKLVSKIEQDQRRKKTSGVIIVAEGDKFGATELARLVKEKMPDHEMRVTILGHVQRGGAPSCMDRVLASRLGYAAVHILKEGRWGVMVGQMNGQITETPFEKATKREHSFDKGLLEMARRLSI